MKLTEGNGMKRDECFTKKYEKRRILKKTNINFSYLETYGNFIKETNFKNICSRLFEFIKIIP